MKKVVSIFVLSAAVLMSVFAADAVWEWPENEARITNFRYQFLVDGVEDPEAWVVVENTEEARRVVIEDVEEGASYTLALQSTYDGSNWSESAQSTIVVE